MTMSLHLNPSGLARTAGTYARDLAERVTTTFLQAFAGGVVITQPLNVSMWHAAAAGGVGAALALLKGLVARAVGDPNSASATPGV